MRFINIEGNAVMMNERLLDREDLLMIRIRKYNDG
jgi:hypothetical protein